MQRLVEQIKNADVNARLVELSVKEGGAWVADKIDFSFDVAFIKFASPSKVPDSYIESHDGFYKPVIGYKGKVLAFSDAARFREQNRACGCQ